MYQFPFQWEQLQTTLRGSHGHLPVFISYSSPDFQITAELISTSYFPKICFRYYVDDTFVTFVLSHSVTDVERPTVVRWSQSRMELLKYATMRISLHVIMHLEH